MNLITYYFIITSDNDLTALIITIVTYDFLYLLYELQL